MKSTSRLRWLAHLFVRGPHADFIRHDLEEMYARDRASGVSGVQAHARYVRHMIGSALSIWRSSMHWPQFPGIKWLDVKLATRMLVRHPGLTIVGGLALTIGIPISLAPIQLINAISAPPPVRAGDRIVGLEYFNGETSDHEPPIAGDYERWRRELESLESVAAARRRAENLVGPDGLTEVVRGAEMSASAFDVADVRPLFGRLLTTGDEHAPAPPVVVIGYDLWQKHFHGEAAALGQTLRFGSTVRTVVGIMPAGFQFPFRESFWVPLQIRTLDPTPEQAPRLLVFGRLRDGVTIEQAQAELESVGVPAVNESAGDAKRLRPTVSTYAALVTGLRVTFGRGLPVFAVCLLLLGSTCGNVGTLMFARAATRSSEIAVRHALGAGRARIVMEFFVEALVLSTCAAAVGLILGQLAIDWLLPARFKMSMPYWFTLDVQPFTILVAGGLVLFSAVIAGLLPALKATRTNVYDSLQRQGSGNAGLKFGRVAAVLIVVEVAVAVAGLSGVSSVARGAFRRPSLGANIEAQEFLTAELKLPMIRRGDAESGQPLVDPVSRFADIETELSRRLALEPGVRGTTFATRLPGMDHGRALVEMEAGGGDLAHTVRVALIEPGFFETLGQSMIAGREFHTRDLTPRGRSVIVNRSFVDQVMHGRTPIGLRLRHKSAPNQEPEPWRDVIGVVDDLGMNVVDPSRAAGVYHVIAHGEAHPVQLVVRLRGNPDAFVPRLRTMLNDIEPGIVLANPARLDAVLSERLWEARFSSWVFALIAVIGTLLAAAGLYSLMALSVTQRRREIAIRVALGASRSSIAQAVIGRAMAQLVAGVLLGAGLAAVVVPEVLSEMTQAANWRVMLVAVSTGMVAIGLLACVVPTRRALGIQPVAALKELG